MRLMAEATQQQLPQAIALFEKGVTAHKIHKLRLVNISRSHLYRIFKQYKKGA